MGLAVFEDTVLGEDAGEIGQGIDETAAADEGAGVEHGVAANFGAIADDGTEFAESGRGGAIVVVDGDVFAIEADVGEDDAAAEVGTEAEDGIADVVEVRDFAVVKEDAVFEFAGVSEGAAFADDDVFPEVSAGADDGVPADPGGAFDDGAGFDDDAFVDEDVFAEVDAGGEFGADFAFEAELEVGLDAGEGGPDGLVFGEEQSVLGGVEVQVVAGAEVHAWECGLHGEDFFFLGGDVLVDIGDAFVGEGLDFFFEAMEVVFGDEAFFLAFFEGFDGIPASGPDADFGFLAHLADEFDHLLTAFLGESGNGESDDFAFDGAVQAEAGLADGAVDVAQG